MSDSFAPSQLGAAYPQSSPRGLLLVGSSHLPLCVSQAVFLENETKRLFIVFTVFLIYLFIDLFLYSGFVGKQLVLKVAAITPHLRVR